METDVKLEQAISERSGIEGRATISSRGTKILSKLFGTGKRNPKDASDSAGIDGADAGGGEEHTDNVEPLPRKVKTFRKKGSKSKGSVLAELRAEEQRREIELHEGLTVSERGYLPVHVRSKLLDLNNIPQTPVTESSKGVVMFADISGFTNLGKELRAQMAPLEAASKLAIRIGTVLKELTNICHEFEGDVVKFAGDALLCVWENRDEQWMLERAKACAVSMLNKIKEVDSQLDLHGGIAMGNLLHVHLGDRRQELLWYLLTGDAAVRAANLVDEAPRGHILYQPRKSTTDNKAEPSAANVDSRDNSSEVPQAPTLTRLPSVMDYEDLTAATKTLLIPTHQRQKSMRGATDDDMPLGSPGDTRRASLEYQEGQSESMMGRTGTRLRTSTEDDPFLNMKITPRGRAYIPRALKNILMSGRIESGEMRNRVAILFAALPSMVLQEDEIVSNKLSEERVRLLNDTFAHMSAILRQLDGAFRDLLFDDKGCIFIAVFGAYGAIEMPELKALKAARRMSEELEVEDLKIGVSVGTCFVGLVGNDVRHDMVVMGHEVNMAARYMAKSQQGSILVSPKIQQATRDFFAFQDVQIVLNKKNAPGEMEHHPSARRFQNNENDLTGDSEGSAGSTEGSSGARKDSVTSVSDPNGAVLAYQPTKEITRRASFTALYRYTQVIPDQFFVGRKAELQKLQGHMLKASTTKQSSLCIVAGPRGYGKSWLIREFRHRNEDKFSSALGVAFELNVNSPLFVFRQILESLFELFDGMPKSKAKLVITQWTQANIKIDYAILERLFPYIIKLIPNPRRASSAQASGLGVSARFGKLIGSMRFTANPLNEEALPDGVGGVETGGGENGSPGPTAFPAMKKQPSLEKMAGSSPGSPMMEEIRHSTGSGGATVAHSPPRVRAGSHSGGATARYSSLGGSRRMISARNLLAGGGLGDAVGRKTTAGSSRTLLGTEAGTAGTATQQATPATSPQNPQLSKSGDAATLKRRLARKQSRPEINLVMGQKELDPLVKFIMSLLEFAASEAIKVGKKGLVIIVEDIQWLDALSLQVLNELVDRMLNSRGMQNLFILASCRNADPDKPDEEYFSSNASDMRPLLEQRFLERTKEVKLFNLVEVDVLSRDEVDSLVSKILIRGTGDSVSSEILDAVFKNSGGMPNAIADVIELIRQDGGAIFLDPNTNQWRWRTATGRGHLAAGGQSVLHAARQAFVSRIDNLSLATRDLLKIAACVSDDKSKFRLQDIVDVLSLDLENKSRYTKATAHVPTLDYISNKLQEAVSAGLLKFRRQFLLATEDWGFASSAIAETVLEMVPSDRLKEIKGMKQNIETAKTGAAAEGLFDFLGGV